MSKYFYIFTGAQGSGKTTQGRLLADKLNLEFVSAGEFLRHLHTEDDPIGELLASYWIKGELVPDDIIEELLFRIFDKSDKDGFILDGFPRELDQYDSFINRIRDKKWSIKGIIFLDITNKEAIKRIQARRKSEHRLDEDNMEALEKRLKIYNDKTLKLIKIFKENHSFIEIDGSKTIQEVHKEVVTKL